jgi:hypothetical protein
MMEQQLVYIYDISSKYNPKNFIDYIYLRVPAVRYSTVSPAAEALERVVDSTPPEPGIFTLSIF